MTHKIYKKLKGQFFRESCTRSVNFCTKRVISWKIISYTVTDYIIKNMATYMCFFFQPIELTFFFRKFFYSRSHPLTNLAFTCAGFKLIKTLLKYNPMGCSDIGDMEFGRQLTFSCTAFLVKWRSPE